MHWILKAIMQSNEEPTTQTWEMSTQDNCLCCVVTLSPHNKFQISKKRQACSHCRGGFQVIFSTNHTVTGSEHWLLRVSQISWWYHMKSVGMVLVPYETNGADAAQGCWSSFLMKEAIQAVLAINTSLFCHDLLRPFYVHNAQMIFFSFLEYPELEGMLKRWFVKYRHTVLIQRNHPLYMTFFVCAFWE